MAEYDKALEPEDLARLFAGRASDGDAPGTAAPGEEQAVMAGPPGSQTAGRDATRGLREKALATPRASSREPPLPARSAATASTCPRS